jgi:methionine synthase II (cobalamin-independent)
MPVMIPPPGYLATGIGALPHTDPAAAWSLASSLFPEFPFVPTLPRRGLLERIVFNDSAHLPGRILSGERMFVDTRKDHSTEIEQIYQDFLEDNAAPYESSPEYASVFHEMLADPPPHPRVLKCQVTGPVTFGMQVTDCNKRPIFYDPQYADILGKILGLQARWLENEIRRRTSAASSLVVFNEPYLTSLGSSVVPLDQDAVAGALTDASSLLEGGYGIHCCANTDWAFILSLEPSVLSFDAFLLSREFLLYGDSIAAFLEKGGVVAWGIVPVDYTVFQQESVRSLCSRIREIRNRLAEFIDAEVIDRQSLITPTCGIQSGTEKMAEEIMTATALLAKRCREEFL